MNRPPLLWLVFCLLGCKQSAEEAPVAPEPSKPKVVAPPSCEAAPAIANLDVFSASGDRPATPTAVLSATNALYVVGYAFDGPLGMAWLVRRAPMQEPTRWSTVDRFEDGNAFATGVAETKDGIIVVGNVQSGGRSTWVVRASEHGDSKTWRTEDEYLGSPKGTTVPRDVASNADGVAIAVGEADFGDGKPDAWVVRRRGSNGKWSNADVFRSPGAKSTAAAAVAIAGLQVYVVGNARSSKGGLHWIVRRSRDGGATWATVDRRAGAVATDVTVGPDNTVYVVGYVERSKNKRTWLTMSSADQGATWGTLNSKAAPTAGGLTAAHAVVADAAGVVYVGGSIDRRGNTRWTLRRSTKDRGVLETIDEYHHDKSHDAADKIDDLAIDGRGEVVAIGDVYARSRVWVVRGHPCVAR